MHTPWYRLKAMPNGFVPLLIIVLITVIVEVSITETKLLPAFVTYKLPLLRLNAIPNRLFPTGISAKKAPYGGLLSVMWQITGNGIFILGGVPISEPFKETEGPLFVVVAILNSSVVR